MDTSSLQRYLHEIGAIALLSAEEEVALATAMAVARDEHTKPADDRRKEVLDAGKRARAQLIEANLRLVVAIATQFSRGGLPLLDVIAAGNRGLMHAVDKFDPTKGCRFSTYATWWIKQAIRRALHDNRLIHLPEEIVVQMATARRLAGRLEQELSREPTAAEIAQQMGVSAEQVAELRRLYDAPESLDVPVNPTHPRETFGELLEDRGSLSPDEVAVQHGIHDVVDQLLDGLTRQQRTAIRLRYGLDEQGYIRTQAEAGREMGVSRERVRQLEDKALRQLRTHAASRLLTADAD